MLDKSSSMIINQTFEDEIQNMSSESYHPLPSSSMMQGNITNTEKDTQPQNT